MSAPGSPARRRLALAADLPLREALALYARISSEVGVAKVGLSLFVEHGPAAVEAFLELGAEVFLDLKLHDIPNTVALAARAAGELGVGLLTVHASGGEAMIRAAVAGAHEGASRRGHPAPRVLAVTALTSLSDADLAAVGFREPAPRVVSGLAALAVRAGAGGLVCSPRELSALRSELGPSVFLCTPGIRPAGASGGDQARAETPSFAVRAGADLLVVGRPIHAAADPVAAARQIAAEISMEG